MNRRALLTALAALPIAGLAACHEARERCSSAPAADSWAWDGNSWCPVAGIVITVAGDPIAFVRRDPIPDLEHRLHFKIAEIMWPEGAPDPHLPDYLVLEADPATLRTMVERGTLSRDTSGLLFLGVPVVCGRLFELAPEEYRELQDRVPWVPETT